MAETIPRETKSKGQKTHSPKSPKRRRELVFLMVGSYLTHNPYNVVSMQIVKSNNNGRSKTSITYQSNFILYSKG